MKLKKHNLNEYTIDHDFYAPFSLLSTIKSFDLQAIRERYLKTRGKKSNRTGSVERRKVTVGGIARLTIEKGELRQSEVLARMPEPRGIHCLEDRIALSSENRAFVIARDRVFTLDDPWFSYIHTVQFNAKDPSRLLISSSGFDSIFEYDFLTNQKTFEWFAWEHGFASGRDPETGEKVYLTRDKSKALEYEREDRPHVFIDNPVAATLPTAKRAAFINSVVYDTKTDKLLATFFHEGAVFHIGRKNGQATKVLDQLKTPHGGQRYGTNFMGTSTGSGEVVMGNTEQQYRYDFGQLPGKPGYLSDMEWIQNAVPVDKNIVAIDSNRNAFIIFNPARKLIDVIAYDNNWAVQDLAVTHISAKQASLIRELDVQSK